MKRFIDLNLSIFVLCPGRSVAQEKCRAASGGFSTVIRAVLWVACEKKLFRKHCLDREYLAVESGTPALQALLANEFQIVFTTGAPATTANLQGADTTIVAVGINFIPNKLLARPDIKTPEGPERKENSDQPSWLGLRLCHPDRAGEARRQPQRCNACAGGRQRTCSAYAPLSASNCLRPGE